jgi:HKD family nuclease
MDHNNTVECNTLIEGNKEKLSNAIVGIYNLFTEPQLLFTLHDWGKLLWVNSRYKKEVSFQPKFYLFEKGNQFSVITGSSPLSLSAFYTNMELNVFFAAPKVEGEKFVFDLPNPFPHFDTLR